MTEAGWTASADAIRISRLPAARLSVLRVRKPNEAVVASIAKALSSELPLEPNTVAVGSARTLWLAPGEWLIVDHAVEGGAIEAAAPVAHIVEVTDGRVVYEVAGPNAETLLAKGCTLDFHPRAFAPQSCAQSALAQTLVLIERTDQQTFHIYADASLARHLELWFEDALIEFQLGKLH
ncbi:MAG: hypothetical protein JHD35_01990 [Sphingopyxis sp.]|nr:hypothetical protein [Sphingopyxis sp.]